MSFRNLSPQRMFIEMAAEHVPQYAFNAKTDFAKWKKQALEDFVHLFEDEHKGERAKEVEHEKQVDELYAEIGRLSAQLSWLKKKSGFKFE